jgi:hypothetical protein
MLSTASFVASTQRSIVRLIARHVLRGIRIVKYSTEPGVSFNCIDQSSLNLVGELCWFHYMVYLNDGSPADIKPDHLSYHSS